MIKIRVLGMPRPQGSMQLRKLPNGGATGTYPPAVWDWRHKVQQAVAEAMLDHDQIMGPLELKLGFDLPRPSNHWLPANSRRREPVLHPNAPEWPSVMPDLDKLVRCIGDAITDAGLWKDDAQVVSIIAAKRYVTSQPGVLITITEL
jgi:crossover junction endodeoxyribonuclease RusA